jgi:hypothetical protein
METLRGTLIRFQRGDRVICNTDQLYRDYGIKKGQSLTVNRILMYENCSFKEINDESYFHMRHFLIDKNYYRKLKIEKLKNEIQRRG